MIRQHAGWSLLLGCWSASGCTTTNTAIEGGHDGGYAEASASPPHYDGGADAASDSRAMEASTKDGGAPDGVVTALDGAKDAPVDTFMCDPMQPPSSEPCVISETFGVFVAPAANGGSDMNGSGTRAAPYATISHALASLGTLTRVYVCNGTYVDSVKVTTSTDGAAIYGGLACPEGDAGAAWSYEAGFASVAPSTQGYALDVESLVKGVVLEDLAFTAQGADAGVSGASSIAVFVNASTGVSFTRVSAIAGASTAGASGMMVPATPGGAGSNWCPVAGQGGSAAINNGAGGGRGTCSCAVVTGDSSTGGAGGGATGGGLNGGSTPAATGASTTGADGIGGMGSTATHCENGDQGANGAATSAGTAGGSGTLSSGGWSASAGGAGSAGDPGQGGGGGGGTSSVGGAGGGAGGCGGVGGAPGSGGGASFAIAAVNSSVTFASMTLVTAGAGAGGAGAMGETGQMGGPGGSNGTSQCFGGNGGAGAGGSGGGGGAGGPSVGIAWAGSATSLTLDGTVVTALAMLNNPSSFMSGGGGDAGLGGGMGAASMGGNPGLVGPSGPVGSSNAVAGF